MIIVFEKNINSLLRCIVRLFTGKMVHCFIAEKNDTGGYWVWDFFKGNLEMRIVKKLPENIEIVHIKGVYRELDEITDDGSTEYDWWAIILAYLFGLHVQDDSRFYCSELIATVLKMTGQYDGNTNITPTKLYNSLMKAKLT